MGNESQLFCDNAIVFYLVNYCSEFNEFFGDLWLTIRDKHTFIGQGLNGKTKLKNRTQFN